MNQTEQVMRDLIVAAKLEASAAVQEAKDAIGFAKLALEWDRGEGSSIRRTYHAALSTYELLKELLLKFDAARADK